MVTGALSSVFDQISVHPQLVIVVPALMILGYALKRTPKVQDWMIVWILLGAGIMASIFTLGFSVSSIANGFIAAGAAITTHQAYKQSVVERDNDDKNKNA
ncbi:phage holin family protein [Peribacillus frigoritolerans]|uniref:phage holin family protein n=1 Tax=Peribacillus frigoritolerans TaxID=450367 RepID=UPI00256FB59B|nr:phage holin family protein [Peribacillus frigoritolerans]